MQADGRLRATVECADHETGFRVADQWGTSGAVSADSAHCISCRSSRLGRQPAAARVCELPLFIDDCAAAIGATTTFQVRMI